MAYRNRFNVGSEECQQFSSTLVHDDEWDEFTVQFDMCK